MTTATAQTEVIDTIQDDAHEYRAIHTGALLGLLLAIVSLVFPMTVSSFADVRHSVFLGILPAVGLIISLWALSAIRANSDLYTGGRAATAGVLIAGLSLVCGATYGGYVYATEVPDGYSRTSFLEMKPDEIEKAGGQMIPPAIQDLIGKKVFIKGYMRPDSTNSGLRTGVTEFLLVRDNNQCCFGDVSKVQYFDQIAVRLKPELATDLSRRVFKMGGELTYRLGNQLRGEPPLVYELQADYVN